MAPPNDFSEYAAQYGLNTSIYAAPPAPPRSPGFFGYGAGQGGAMGGAMQTLAPMIGEMFRSQLGGYGFNFGADQNIANTQLARDFLRQMKEARSLGAQADRSQVEDLVRGMAVAIGHKPLENRRTAGGRVMFSSEVERAVSQFSGDASNLLPIFAAMFPDTVDRILPRGSMTVASGSFTNAGRFVVDPLTGKSASESADFAARVLTPLMNQGPEATSGLRAGRLGSIYEALVQRGQISSGRDLAEQVDVRNKTGGLFGIGMDRNQAGDIQARRVGSRLQEYSKVVSAINDIFAANGQANAPLSELLQSLEVMTQGGMSVYDPRRLADIARTLQGASLMSGMSLQSLTRVSAATGGMLNEYGGPRGLAAPIALQAAAAGSVAADMGFNAPSPEGMSREAMVAAVARDRAAFAGSDMGNRIGSIMNLAAAAKPGSRLAQVAAALAKGETGAAGFDVRTAQLHDITKLAAESGISEFTTITQTQNELANRAMLVRNPDAVNALGPKIQQSEIEQLFMNRYGPQLQGMGVDPQKFFASMYKVAARGDITGDAQFGQELAKDLGLGQGAGAELGAFVGNVGQLKGMSGYNLARLSSPQVRAQMDAAMGRFTAEGRRQARLTHLARGGFLSNLSNAISGMGEDGKAQNASWLSFALKTMGFASDMEAGVAPDKAKTAALGGPGAFAELLTPVAPLEQQLANSHGILGKTLTTWRNKPMGVADTPGNTPQTYQPSTTPSKIEMSGTLNINIEKGTGVLSGEGTVPKGGK